MALAISYDGSTRHRGHGFQVHVGPMRPTSHGTVRLRSADPRDPPLIRFNYLQTELDRQEMRESIRQAREVIGQKAFDPFRGRLRRELPRKTRLGDYTDDDIDDVIWSLNTTPRKCLGFRTPIEAFAINLGVALGK